MKVEEAAAQMRPTFGQPQAVSARIAGELAISGIAVILQDAAIIAEITRREVAGPTVLDR